MNREAPSSPCSTCPNTSPSSSAAPGSTKWRRGKQRHYIKLPHGSEQVGVGAIGYVDYVSSSWDGGGRCLSTSDVDLTSPFGLTFRLLRRLVLTESQVFLDSALRLVSTSLRSKRNVNPKGLVRSTSEVLRQGGRKGDRCKYGYE